MTPMFSLTYKLESFEAKLKLFCPDISVSLVNPADHLGDLGLSQEQLFLVRERVNQVHQANSGAVNAQLGRLKDAFLHVYDLTADLTDLGLLLTLNS